jgi:hypothetical protein
MAVALSIASAASIPLTLSCFTTASAQQAAQTTVGAVARHVGAIKDINGNQITLTPDSGPDVSVIVQATARVVRIAPGEKDLKNATPVQLQDLQVGDRILVAGKTSDDTQSLLASSVVVMKRSDLEARHQQDLQDWQKRGVDGVATAVDAAAGTVTISVRSKNIVIHTSTGTTIRRYAPDSVKFDDAKPGTLAEIHPGDQVRARGDRSADGSELAPKEIVSGAFRNIAGTLNSVDAGASTLSVHDLLSNKSVVIKTTPDSQLRQLPPEIAQRIATRLRGLAAPGVASTTRAASPAQGSRPSSGMGAGNGGGAPDFQQMLGRLPAVSLADLHKGDAVIVLSTVGTAGVGTAITLLTGVEPILRAAPNASGASILTPWSLSAPSGDLGGP